jgi:hypothetical protein
LRRVTGHVVVIGLHLSGYRVIQALSSPPNSPRQFRPNAFSYWAARRSID